MEYEFSLLRSGLLRSDPSETPTAGRNTPSVGNVIQSKVLHMAFEAYSTDVRLAYIADSAACSITEQRMLESFTQDMPEDKKLWKGPQRQQFE
jgi:hypothetical protein